MRKASRAWLGDNWKRRWRRSRRCTRRRRAGGGRSRPGEGGGLPASRRSGDDAGARGRVARARIMMSPERQQVNPFFLGGDEIIVSSPDRHDGYETRLHRACGPTTSPSRAPRRSDPGSHPHYLHVRPVPRLPPVARRHARSTGRGLAALLEMRSATRASDVARRRSGCSSGGCTGARASSLAEVPHGGVVAAGVRRLPGGPGRPRAITRSARCVGRSTAAIGPLYQAAYMLGGIQLTSPGDR